MTGYYDIHLLQTLSHERMELWKKHNRDEKNLAIMVSTPMFHHTPLFGERFRGSGRLQAEAQSSAEQWSHYICVSVSREWGVTNRAQTVCLLASFAAMHKFGMYVAWTPKKACNCTMTEVFDINTESEIYKSLPFVKVFDSENNSNWKAAVSNQHWNIHTFDSQCQVDM